MTPISQTDTTEPEPPAAQAPMHRRRSRRRTTVESCLNCGAPVDAHFCPQCGQETHDQSVALGSLAGEFVSELVSFDGKLVRTIVPLLFRPGFLTNEFNMGRRVRYLSPLRMYLVISALFFFVLAQQSAVKHIQETSFDTQSHSHTKLNSSTKPDSFHLQVGGKERDLPLTVAAYDRGQKALPAPQRDHGLTRYVMHQLIKSRQSPKSLISSFMDNLPRMMFVLLPAFALLLKITYWRTRRLYVEHLIFALHTHSFVFLLLIAAFLAANLPLSVPVYLLVNIGVPVYLYIALRAVYKQGRGRTLLAFAWTALNYVILLTVAFLLTLGAAFLLA